MKIFDLDGPFQKYGSIVFDLLVLNILFFFIGFGSIGLLIGIANIAMYFAIYNSVIVGKGYTFKMFFSRFKERFLTGTATYLILTLFMILSGLNIWWILIGQITMTWLLPVYSFTMLELILTMTFMFPLAAHSKLKIGGLLKYSFLLANKHLPTAVLSSAFNVFLVLLGIIVFFMGYVQYLFFFMFVVAIVALINSQLITKRALTKYTIFYSPFDSDEV